MKYTPQFLARSGVPESNAAFLLEYERAVLLNLHRLGLLSQEQLEASLQRLVHRRPL